MRGFHDGPFLAGEAKDRTLIWRPDLSPNGIAAYRTARFAGEEQ
jgi:hypothetical protein